MAIPMKNGGMPIEKVIFYVILSGVTTGIGAFFGAIIGSISETIISINLSFAAGAMLYIVSGELIPESNKLYKGRISAVRKYDRIYYWNISNTDIKLLTTKNKKYIIQKQIKIPIWGRFSVGDSPFKNRPQMGRRRKICKKY